MNESTVLIVVTWSIPLSKNQRTRYTNKPTTVSTTTLLVVRDFIIYKHNRNRHCSTHPVRGLEVHPVNSPTTDTTITVCPIRTGV